MTFEELYLRLVKFAKKNQTTIKTIQISLYNRNYINQLLRSSSSVGANYIEAIEAISKKDFVHRLKICRKETREPLHWLPLLKDTIRNRSILITIDELIEEVQELTKIFTSSILTAERNLKIAK